MRASHLDILRFINIFQPIRENDDEHMVVRKAGLEFEASRGEEVLEIAQNYSRELGFTAKFMLKQWRKGELETLSKWSCKTRKSLEMKHPSTLEPD